jgi:hypothetical protein
MTQPGTVRARRMPAIALAVAGALLAGTVALTGGAAAAPSAPGPGVPSGRVASVAAGLPALPAAWPFDRLELGLADAPGGAASLRAAAPFGLRYQYLAGGVNTGSGWQTWNTGGQFVTWYVEDSVDHGVVPVFTYYMLLQSSPATGGDEAAKDLSNLRNTATMAAWWADLRVFFQRAATSTPVVLHVEPDLWGYIEQAASGDDAGTVPAAVASSGFADVAGYANTAAGFAKAIVHLRDAYAPNVILAYHLSGWGTMVDLHANAPSDAQTDALAVRAGSFYASLGAGFDLAFTDIADRDAGWRRVVAGDGGASWWTAVDFPRWGRFIAGFVAATGKRVAVWQIPLGNTKMRALDDTWGHFQDNRVEWFLEDAGDGHLAAWRDAGVIALLYGGGASGTTCACDASGDGLTNPAAINGNTRVSLSADDDGGYFKDRAAAYYAGGGLALAPGGPGPTPTPTPTPTPKLTPTPAPTPPPTPGATWTVRAYATPVTVHRRHSVAITIQVTTSRTTSTLLDVMVYDPSGRRVGRYAWDRVTFTANRTRSIRWSWYASPTRPLGVYTIKVGVYRPGWAKLLAWNNRARTFRIIP